MERLAHPRVIQVPILSRSFVNFLLKAPYSASLHSSPLPATNCRRVDSWSLACSIPSLLILDRLATEFTPTSCKKNPSLGNDEEREPLARQGYHLLLSDLHSILGFITITVVKSPTAAAWCDFPEGPACSSLPRDICCFFRFPHFFSAVCSPLERRDCPVCRRSYMSFVKVPDPSEKSREWFQLTDINAVMICSCYSSPSNIHLPSSISFALPFSIIFPSARQQ